MKMSETKQELQSTSSGFLGMGTTTKVVTVENRAAIDANY